MGSVKKNRLIRFSVLRKNISQKIIQTKPYQYAKALLHILFRIQPFFSIFLAVLITVPLAYGFTYGIDVLTENADKNVFTEGIIGNFKKIDPLPFSPSDKPFSQINRDITRLLFDPLFVTDPSGNLVGVLASGYESKDNGSKFIVKIKEGRTWSNGDPIKASDIYSTFNLIKKTGSDGIYYAAIDGVEALAIDNYTIQFSLATPNSSFLDTLYWPVLPSVVANKTYNEILNSDFVTNPISSTNWNISSITEKDVTLKNSEINKRIKFVFYKDIFDLDKALNAGFINGYYSLNLIKNKNFQQVSKYTLPRQIYSLYFNMTDSASDSIKDPNIRKAISYGIDRTAVAEELGTPRQSIYAENSWAFNPDVETYKYDVKKANDLLDAAGYKYDGEFRKANGKEIQFTITIPEISVRQIQAKKIQENMKAIGINTSVKAIKDSQFIDNELKGNLFYKSTVLTKNFDAMIYSVDASLDPDKFSQWHSSKIPNIDKNIIGLNFEGYSDVRVDAYLRQGRNQYDQAARKVPYAQFQKVFYDDAPVVTLYNPFLFYATSNKVKNIDFTGAVRIEDRFANFDKWEF